LSASDAPPLRVDVPEDPQVAVAFSGREGNVSLVVGGGDVEAARRSVLGHVGIGLDAAVFMEQVHGGRAARVGVGDRGRGIRDRTTAEPGTDALVTFDLDVALVVMVADCVPVMLADPGRGVGAVHVGRRGLEAGVVAAAVATLAGGNPGRIVALLGPAIGGCCYEVPGALAERVARLVPAVATQTTWGTPALDLPAGVASQLHATGVARVEAVGSCTRCHPERWHSHRRDPASGRQAAVICRRNGSAAPAERWTTAPYLH
jgi:YfiH family protein